MVEGAHRCEPLWQSQGFKKGFVRLLSIRAVARRLRQSYGATIDGYRSLPSPITTICVSIFCQLVEACAVFSFHFIDSALFEHCNAFKAAVVAIVFVVTLQITLVVVFPNSTLSSNSSFDHMP